MGEIASVGINQQTNSDYQVLRIGWASVLKTTLLRSRLLRGANIRYRYLSVSARKKLCMMSAFSNVVTFFSAA